MHFALWLLCLVACISIAIARSPLYRNRTKIISANNDYSIYHPFGSLAQNRLRQYPVISTPEQWLAIYSAKTDRLRTILDFAPSTSASKARLLYAETLLRFVTGLVYGDEEVSAVPVLGTSMVKGVSMKEESKVEGLVWSGYGSTMVGVHRLRNIHFLLATIFKENIPGGYLEAGVWRGGASVFARGLLRIYGEASRPLYVCDSFRGLPPSILPQDIDVGSWDHTRYTEVSAEEVAMNFIEMGVADANTIFVKGFFNASMQPLRQHILSTHASPTSAFAILRLDADMYESTVDVLYHLYDLLSVGGYVVMDDWFGGFASRTACEDFFKVHNIHPEIVKIDTLSVYWKKEKQIKLQYWRYENQQFT